MKLKIYTITTLFILLSATFSQSIYAQTAKKQVKVLTQEEADKREVEKFVDKFVLTFEKTKDIQLIPKRFFDSSFKHNIINTYKEMFFGGMNDEEAKILNKLSDNELYKNFILAINFSYLNLMVHDGICCEGGSSNLFSAKVLKTFNKQETRAVSMFVNTSDEMPHKNINQYYELISSILTINQAQLRYIKNRSSFWKKKYNKNIANTRKQFEGFRRYLCSDEDCYGQKIGTEMFEINAYPYILIILEKNGTYKISNIFPYMN